MNPLLLIALLGGAVTAGSVTYAVAKRPRLQKTSAPTSTTPASTAAGAQTEPTPATAAAPPPTPATAKYKLTFTPGITVFLDVGDTIEVDPPTPTPSANGAWVFTSSDASIFSTYACSTEDSTASSNCVGFANANNIGYYQATAVGTATLALGGGDVSGVMTIQVSAAGAAAPAGASTTTVATPTAVTGPATTYKQTFAPGTSISLKVGDTIEIDAPYAPTGGNRWNFESSNAAIFATFACATAMNATSGDFPIVDKTQAQCAGYPATTDIGYYQAIAPGIVTFSLGYGTGTPVFSSTMTIEVSAASTPSLFS